MIILYVLQIVYFVVYIFVLYLLRFEGLYKIVQSNLYSAPWYNDFRIEKSCDAPNLLNDRDLGEVCRKDQALRRVEKGASAC